MSPSQIHLRVCGINGLSACPRSCACWCGVPKLASNGLPNYMVPYSKIWGGGNIFVALFSPHVQDLPRCRNIANLSTSRALVFYKDVCLDLLVLHPSRPLRGLRTSKTSIFFLLSMVVTPPCFDTKKLDET